MTPDTPVAARTLRQIGEGDGPRPGAKESWCSQCGAISGNDCYGPGEGLHLYRYWRATDEGYISPADLGLVYKAAHWDWFDKKIPYEPPP